MISKAVLLLIKMKTSMDLKYSGFQSVLYFSVVWIWKEKSIEKFREPLKFYENFIVNLKKFYENFYHFR